MEAKALDIEALNGKYAQCELMRRQITARISDHYGLDEDCMALGILAEIAPEPFRKRLQDAADRLAVLRQETTEVVLNGTRSLQQAAEAIYRCMDAFKGCVQLVPESEAALSAVPSCDKRAAVVS